MQEAAEYFQAVMNSCIDQLANDIEEETLNALGWMIFDDILEFKFAIPCKKLIDGDFHDKFGVFMVTVISVYLLPVRLMTVQRGFLIMKV